MNIRWIVWPSLYITGALFIGIQAQEATGNNTSTESATDDYDPNYPDYTDRDYPSVDYDDYGREGRSFNDDYGNTATDEDENDAHEHPMDDFMMKQLRSTIPGEPGVDYALFQSVPDTAFQCGSQRNPGFYGDVDTQCQVFHICQDDGRQDSFTCPIGTVFNQMSFICDWWFNFKCEDTPSYYHLNTQYHSSTSMKDAMNKMRNLRGKKMMKMAMGLARGNKKSVRKPQHRRMDGGFAKRSNTPKVRNLFTLRMRMNKLGRMEKNMLSENIQEDFVTASTLPVYRTSVNTEVVKALGSTGYFDISSEYSTTNSSIDDGTINSSFVTDAVNDSRALLYATEKAEDTLSSTFDTSFNSVLNLSSMEMTINRSIVTTVKLDQMDVPYIETSTASEYLNISVDEHMTKYSEEYEDNKTNTNKENDVEKGEYSNQFRNIESDVRTIELYPLNKTSSNYENFTTSAVSENSVKTTPFPSPTNAPFNHQNNFIIGNDTHISVSVTIHSKSGRSRLQWKRLPGIKRIRKIRYKNAQEVNSNENNFNDTIFKKRMYDEKPKSRIMWIPAKKNSLERRMNWKHFIESRTHDTIADVKLEPDENSLQKSSIEKGVISPIKIGENYHGDNQTEEENKNEDYNQDESANSSIMANSNLDNSLNIPPEDMEIEFMPNDTGIEFISEVTETKLPSLNPTEQNSQNLNVSHSDIRYLNKTEELQTNMPEDKDIEDVSNCKTICIKLLKSLNINSTSESFKNSTNFEKPSGSLTVFEYDNAESQRNPEFDRKSVLGVSPSEQWTVKYDPGPNCNENTEDDKILVKGWSVIVDAGPVTKEKTVKRRGCSGTSNDNQIVLMGNFHPYQNSGDGGTTFKTDASQIPLNSRINEGSMDQRYWLNLVKNWLENSSTNSKKGKNKDTKPSPNKEAFSRTSWMIRGPSVDNNDRQDGFSNDQRFQGPKLSTSQHENSRKSNFANERASQSFQIPSQNQNLYFKSKQNGIMNENKGTRDSMDMALFLRDIEQRQAIIQSLKHDSSSDLQMEKSDWSQATQEASDWSNRMKDGNPSMVDRRHWNSDVNNKNEEYSDNKRISQSSRSNDNRRSSDSRNIRGNRDSNSQGDWLSNRGQDRDALPDRDDRPVKKSYPSNDWSGNRQDDRQRTRPKKPDLPSNFPKDEEKWPSNPTSGRSDWASDSNKNTGRSLNRGEKGFPTASNKPKGSMRPKDSSRRNDWSSENFENKGQQIPRRENDERSGRRGRGGPAGSDNSWKDGIPRDPRNEFSSSSKGGRNQNTQRSQPPSSMRDKGRSLSDEWNWTADKGYDRNFQPMSNDRGWSSEARKDSVSGSSNKGDWSTDTQKRSQDWSSMNPRDDDWSSVNPRNNDWSSMKPRDSDWSSMKSRDNDWSSMKPRGNDWSFMNSEGNDWSSGQKKSRRQDDWMLQNQKGGSNLRLPNSKDDNLPVPKRKTDWFSDELDNWSRDSDLNWQLDSNKKDNNNDDDDDDDDDWKKTPNKGSTSRGAFDWNSEDSTDWNSKGQKNFKSRDNNDWSQENSRNKQEDISNSQWSRADDKPNRASESRGRNKGLSNAQARTSQDKPDWKRDNKESTLPSRSAKGGRSSPPSQSTSSRRTNVKGSPHSDSKRPRNDWADDENRWVDDNSRNRPSQEDTQPRANIPQWKDTEEWSSSPRQDKPKGGSWDSRNSQPDSFRSSSKSDFNRNSRRKMEYDWPSQSDSIPDNTRFAKGSGRGDIASNRPDSSESSEASWSNKNPDSKYGDFDDVPQKPKSRNAGSSWKNEKGNSINPQVSNPMKGGTQVGPEMPWSNDPPKNISNNKGDSGMEKIIWSPRLSSDGSPGSGWIPVTLRPSLKGRENGTKRDSSDKGGPSMDWASMSKDWSSKDKGKDWPSSDSKVKGKDWSSNDARDKGRDWSSDDSKDEGEDWSSNDARDKGRDWSSDDSKDKGSSSMSEDWTLKENKNANWKAELSQYSETTLNHEPDIITETNPSTSQVPEASFSQLFYIPASTNRYKREYKGNKGRRFQVRQATNRSYKVIKSGEILNDVSRDNDNKFFLASADILVEDPRIPNKKENPVHFGLRELFDKESIEVPLRNSKSSKRYSFNDNKGEINNGLKVINRNWDTLPKESTVNERWSSPFYSSNFSASGWIPVTAFKESNSRNFSDFRLSTSEHKDMFALPKDSNKTDTFIPITNSNIHLQNRRISRNISQEVLLNSANKGSNTQENESANYSANKTPPRKTDNETEVKVGNKTLRIISFSDVMKQLQDKDSDLPNSFSSETPEIAWNMPITASPKMYSLKLVYPSKENNGNISNSWFFSTENGTKQAWILTENNKNNENSLSSKDSSTNDFVQKINEKPTEYKIIVGNKTEALNLNKKQMNSNESVTESKDTHPNHGTFHFDFGNSDEESNWKPIVTTIGRVVPFNRTKSSR